MSILERLKSLPGVTKADYTPRLQASQYLASRNRSIVFLSVVGYSEKHQASWIVEKPFSDIQLIELFEDKIFYELKRVIEETEEKGPPKAGPRVQ